VFTALKVLYKGYRHDFSGYSANLAEQTHKLPPCARDNSMSVLSLLMSLQPFQKKLNRTNWSLVLDT